MPQVWRPLVKEYVADSTAHGVPRIVASKRLWQRFFWTGMFLGAFGMFSWQASLLFVRFYSNPVNVNVKVTFEELPFPAVTLCNLNRFKASELHLAGSSFLQSIKHFNDTIVAQLSGGSARRKRRKRKVRQYGSEHSQGILENLNPDGGDSQLQRPTGLRTATESLDKQYHPRNLLWFAGNGNHERQKRQSGNNTTTTAYNGTTDVQTVTEITTDASTDYYTTDYNTTDYNTTDYTLYTQIVTSYESFTSSSYYTGSDFTTIPYSSSYTYTPGYSSFSNSYTFDPTLHVYTTASYSSVSTTSNSYTYDPSLYTTASSSGLSTTSNSYTYDPTLYTTASYSSLSTSPSSSSSSVAIVSTVRGATTETATTAPSTHVTPITTNATTSVLTTTTPAVIWADPNDQFYLPEVDLTDKPWFQNVNEEDAVVAASQNLTAALTSVPITTKREMGHQVDTFIQECSWAGKQCNPRNFTAINSRYYGNCYTFNSGIISPILSSWKPGSLYGLVLTLYIEQAEYIESLSPSAGIRVLVHRQGQQPFPEENGFDVSPGQKTTVSLRLQRTRRLSPPFNNCTDGSGIQLMYAQNYSVPACLRTCQQNNTLSKCLCANPELPVPINQRTCSQDTGEQRCLAEVEKEVEENKLSCYCPQLCQDDIYLMGISSSEWPAESFQNILVEEYSKRSQELRRVLSGPGEFRKNMVRLDVFYEDLNYESITETSAYNVENLLGDIGGQLGLWIGVSALTVAEVIELSLLIVQTFCKRANLIGAHPNVGKKKRLANRNTKSNSQLV